MLRVKEDNGLTEKALADIVNNTTTLIRNAVQTVCDIVVEKLRNVTGEDCSDRVGWEVLSEENVSIANPFQYMETVMQQKHTFQELFGLVVSINNRTMSEFK